MTQYNRSSLHFDINRIVNAQLDISLTIVEKSNLLSGIASFFDLTKLNHSFVNFKSRKNWDEFDGYFEWRLVIEYIYYESLSYWLFFNLLLEQSHYVVMKFLDILNCWFLIDGHHVFELWKGLYFYSLVADLTVTIFKLICVFFR